MTPFHIHIEVDCPHCTGGTYDTPDPHGFHEERCEDCEGSGKLDAKVECGGCDVPVDEHGWCAGCEAFAAGYEPNHEQRRAA